MPLRRHAARGWAVWFLLSLAAMAAGPEYVATDNGVMPEDLWALSAVERPAIPDVQANHWAAGPIDRFILAGLEAQGMQPSPPLARARLVRRLYFDLWGLPPSPQAMQAALADESAGSYERLVDRLLASRHYGERWARYWLDLVRFAESNGYERDALKEGAWRYRDWVIDSLNEDKPYDRFVLEQLAGDELPGASEATRVATGFLRVGTFDDEPNDPARYKYEQLDDLVHATSTALLGITLKCARCHDHKFDPIPQRDYYAFLNFFIGGKPADGALLAFTDVREPPPVRLLKAGEPGQAGDVVPPGFLSMLPELARPIEPPPPDSATSTRRTQLARWVADRGNPLTARVMVNRLWQHHFGEGLVRTPDNFGMLSEAPTHPELLDWLAVEFMEGGWRMKRLHRMILLSSTYRMDSNHPLEAEYARRDFHNQHWWRANRRRLDAEALRDAMLAVSGQIELKPGGPSFYPPASKEALEGLSKKDAAWGTSPPEEQRRRSIYMMTRRSLLLPLMTTFDFADTTQPCSQRNVSTVAPQALALLNNEFVHAQSTALADRVAAEAGGGSDERIELAWRLALSRSPSSAERAAAIEHLAAQEKRFPARPAAGATQAAADGTLHDRTLSDTAGRPGDGDAGRLALASLCHVLLNTNEFIYVD